MKKEYSKKVIKRILSQDVKVSEVVEDRMKETYESLGISSKVTMRYTKKHRVWSAVAAIAILAVGMSVVTFAASKFLSADLVEKEDSVQYSFNVDKTHAAHEIKAEPTYMPEGFALGAENTPYGGKWYKEETEEVISIFTYNAAELDKMQRLGEGEFAAYKKDSHLKTININGMQTDVFVNDGFYVDSANTRKNIYLFNEKDGYGIWISSGSGLSADELLKVAKGMQVEILDETVPYATDAEIEDELAAKEQALADSSKEFQMGIPADSVYEIGEEVRDPLIDESKEYIMDDVGFTVEDVRIEDFISFTDYPSEYFISFTEELAPWVLADGTLKPHDRYKYSLDGIGDASEDKILETVSSKYVIVKMKAKNHSTVQSEWNLESGVSIAPDLTVLEQSEDGSLVKPSYSFSSANEGYAMQWLSNAGSSFPIYFDKLYYTDGIQRLKTGFFRPIAPGEELEYTLIYVIDEDQLDNMYLWFFAGTGGTKEDGSPIVSPYVKISE